MNLYTYIGINQSMDTIEYFYHYNNRIMLLLFTSLQSFYRNILILCRGSKQTKFSKTCTEIRTWNYKIKIETNSSLSQTRFSVSKSNIGSLGRSSEFYVSYVFRQTDLFARRTNAYVMNIPCSQTPIRINFSFCTFGIKKHSYF